jgi:rare lipoprotein A (peptidoglycan hydrolase)
MGKKLFFTGLILLVSAFLVEMPLDEASNSGIIVSSGAQIIKDAEKPKEAVTPHVGTASWYDFKGGLFAASPFFKRGTALRVTNLANGKHVDVIVNDYGPDIEEHPSRVIDLDKIAFLKIASLRNGLIKVKVNHLENFN